MGWLVRYTGKKPTNVTFASTGPLVVKPNDVLDITPIDVRGLVRDPDAPWVRIMPYDPDYVAVEARADDPGVRT